MERFNRCPFCNGSGVGSLSGLKGNCVCQRGLAIYKIDRDGWRDVAADAIREGRFNEAMQIIADSLNIKITFDDLFFKPSVERY